MHLVKPWTVYNNTKYIAYPKHDMYYSRSLKVGNPIASILKSNVWGIPALFGLNPVSNFMGLTVYNVEQYIMGRTRYMTYYVCSK